MNEAAGGSKFWERQSADVPLLDIFDKAVIKVEVLDREIWDEMSEEDRDKLKVAGSYEELTAMSAENKDMQRSVVAN